MQGLVSIVIPCYNAEKYLDKCLTSLLEQTYKNIEVIIVNDGSTDDSEKIIDKYAKKYEAKGKQLIKINQKNAGQAAAVNQGLKKVTGEYIMWQDSDDWMEKDAIENLVNFLNENNYNVARGEAAFRNQENINEICYHAKSNSPNDKNVFNKYLFQTDSYCYCGIFICRTKHFDKCIKNREIYISRAGQNWQLILPITYQEECGYLNKIVYNYRILQNSHSHSVKKPKDLIKRYSEHQDILLHVINSLDMSKKEKKYYSQKLKIKYIKCKLRVIIDFFVKCWK